MNKFQEIIDSPKSDITKMTNLLRGIRLEINKYKGNIPISTQYGKYSSDVYKNEFRGYAFDNFPSTGFSSVSEFSNDVQSALEEV